MPETDAPLNWYGKKSIQCPLSDSVTIGGEDGAMCYALDFLPAWKKVQGARDYSKVGRL